MKISSPTVCVLLCGAVSLPLSAQTFGEVTGRVADASGASVPAAVLTLTNTSTNAVRATTSTESGVYTFASVPPGHYNLKAEHPGFKTAGFNGIEVQVQQTVRLDFSLQVGQVSESIEVSAAADLLQAENGTVGTVVDNKGIAELPLNGRQYLNLVALSPNVNTLAPSAGQAGSRQGGDRAAQSISAAGQRIMFDYFTLDGVMNTDPNFNTYVVLPSIDALQEFKVQTGVYPAEFGHQSTQINVLTKSGGNNYHGAFFEFLRNDKMDALPFSFTAKPQAKQPFKWNDFGFVMDGPVRIPKLFNGKNRLFFMANYEAFRRRQNSQSTYSVPTAAMFGGDFSGLGTTINDPHTKAPFPGNVIPTNRIDPISKQLLGYYNSANVPGAGLTSNYVQSNAFPQNRDGFVLRLDFVESSRSQWSGRYSWGDENQSSQSLNLAGNKILTNYEQYVGSNTRTIRPTLVNEARFGYNRFFNSIGTFLAFNTDVITPLGIPGFSGGPPVTWGIPNIVFNGDGFSAIGDSTDGPYANDNNTLQFIDNVSWVHGKHTFKFGGEFMRQNYNQVGNQFSRGQFTFQPNATQSSSLTGGDAFAEFLLGDLYQSEVAVGIANATFQRNMWSAWVDDTWKITSRLTLSLGLRYEVTPPFLDTKGDLFTVYLPHIYFFAPTPQSDWPYFLRQGNCSDPYAGINVVWTQTKAACSNGLLNDRLMQTQYRNFAPRVGISWSPNSRWVFRAGFGDFYNQDIGNAVFDMARNIAGRIRINSDVGNPTIFWSNAAPGGNGAKAQLPPPYAFVDAYSHRTPYSMEYLFNVQRQLSGNWVVEAGYLGSLSHHLYGFQNANSAIPGTVGSALSRTPFPNYGVIQLVHDGGNANYNSGSLKVTRRFASGLSLISSYTFAKSIDNTSGIRTQGYDTLFPQNSDCIQCERGLSSFDTRHRFVTSVVYDVPVGKGRALNVANPVANAVVGGWEVGGIWTVQSGVPQVITIGGVDRSGTGNGYDRPNATLASNGYVSNPTPSRWYDPAAFVEAAAGTYGNVGRDTMVGPAFFALDFDAHKEFRMPYKEGHVLQFRFEAFNVLNHPVWAAPNGNILAGAAFPNQPTTNAHQGFGVVSGTAIAMRQLQLALKYSF
ncbi:MAG TPA: TonB-dependent receptor [Candidatus Acidoferrales bacterium]|nr:TonB-dependent receptor [Candidatus Acidoferrales bacterium]